jgi:threonine/homoserine/homoserine lactone efflux protein
MDQADILDHQFVAAAYIITWAVQLGYLVWLGWRWRTEKRNAERRAHRTR